VKASGKLKNPKGICNSLQKTIKSFRNSHFPKGILKILWVFQKPSGNLKFPEGKEARNSFFSLVEGLNDRIINLKPLIDELTSSTVKQKTGNNEFEPKKERGLARSFKYR
jgi:hypothetical protein